MEYYLDTKSELLLFVAKLTQLETLMAQWNKPVPKRQISCIPSDLQQLTHRADKHVNCVRQNSIWGNNYCIWYADLLLCNNRISIVLLIYLFLYFFPLTFISFIYSEAKITERHIGLTVWNLDPGILMKNSSTEALPSSLFLHSPQGGVVTIA